MVYFSFQEILRAQAIFHCIPLFLSQYSYNMRSLRWYWGYLQITKFSWRFVTSNKIRIDSFISGGQGCVEESFSCDMWSYCSMRGCAVFVAGKYINRTPQLCAWLFAVHTTSSNRPATIKWGPVNIGLLGKTKIKIIWYSYTKHI